MSRASWIVEVRQRLAQPPPVGLATDGPRRAALVPLFVDGGELWLLFRAPDGSELIPGTATLAESPLAPAEDPWAAAERCTPWLGIDPSRLLRLGTLDHAPEPSGDVVVPCVAAVPAPTGERGPEQPPVVRLPLVAARTPSLLEERTAAVKGVETWVTIGHFGPVKLAGVEVEIAELLLERLFHGSA